MESFVVRLVTVDEFSDVNSFVVGLSETKDGSGAYLLLQRSLSQKDQDRRAGLATYSISLPSGVTKHGGVVSCSLKEKTLVLHLNKTAAEALESDGFCMDLQVDDDSVSRLREGLRRIFPPHDRPAQFLV